MITIKKTVLVAMAICGLIACNKEETNLEATDNKVDAYLQFENTFNGNTFALNTDLESENNGTLNITTLKYIITDIVLFGTNGTPNYHATTQESFHIVDASCPATLKKYLTNVPDGEYNKVSFRYGVSEEVHEQGADAQGEMLLAAKEAGLFWGWTTGYRFMTYEGSYHGTGGVEGNFKIHNGSHGSSAGHSHGATTAKTNHADEPHDDKTAKETSGRIDNSKVITLDFSNKGAIVVKNETSPKIHLDIDVAQILNNKNEDANDLDVSDGDIIIDTHKSPIVAKNVAKIFSVDHIHPTDPNFNVPELEACNSTNPNEDNSHKEGDGHSHGE